MRVNCAFVNVVGHERLRRVDTGGSSKITLGRFGSVI
jgi:hypothetical protein